MSSTSVRHACGCTRYLSPTRLALRSDNHRRWRSSSATLTSRWRTESRSPPTGRHKYFQHQSRANSNSSNKLVQYVSYTKESMSNMGSNMKDWLKIKKVPIDVGALSNVIGTLNVEIPKSWPDYRKYLTSKFFREKKRMHINELTRSEENMHYASLKEDKTEKLGSTDSPQQSDLDAAKNVEHHEVDHAQVCSQLIAKAKHGVLSPDGKEVFVREQHDFNEAMQNTYYSTVNLSLGGKQEKSDKKESRKMPSPQRATRILQQMYAVEPTNILTKQLETLKNILPGRVKAPSAKSEETQTSAKVVSIKKDLVSRASIDRRTRGVVLNLRKATTNMSRLMRLEELSRHLTTYPQAKKLAVKEKVLPVLLKLQTSKDANVRELCLECLALVGWVDAVGSRGIRILSLDGGGTRGLMSIQLLRKLEAESNKEIHELFDYICGVSIGSLLGVMLGIFQVPLDECEHLYREFSKEVFHRSRLMGTSKLFTSHAFYDSALWQKILEENIGTKTFLQSRRDHRVTLTSAVSSLVNQPTVENFIFRNYTYPPGVYSHYPGTMSCTFPDAIRASSAAPGYFEEKKIGENIHQDGGILMNNPSAIALHECKLLWPNSSIQCLVSVGTGRFRPSYEPTESYSLKDKLLKIVQSATDTEAVHTMMADLLPRYTYFRFNPHMSEDFMLDETREDKWEQMAHDVEMYCRKNEAKFSTAAQRLTLPRHVHQKTGDWIKLKAELLEAGSWRLPF